MQNDILAPVNGLSDEELVARLKDLAGREREATAELAAHLSELRTRGRPAEVTSLPSDRYEIQVTIDADTLEKMRLVKDMIGHAIPPGDDAAILDLALTALLAHLEN